MAGIKVWEVRILISENDDGGTFAEARLMDGDLRAIGTARLNPHDVDVPEIGDELAAARALGALSERLLRLTADDIAEFTQAEPGRLPRTSPARP